MKLRIKRLPIRQLASFTALPLLAAVAPLLVLPAIGRTLGAAGWAAIATGQSIGAAASILVAYGWPIVGPSVVASLSTSERVSYYLDSIYMRLLLLLPVGAVAVSLAMILVKEEFSLAAGLMSGALCLVGLSASWFYIGVGEPSRVALYDAGPRIVASVISVPALLFSRNAAIYPLILFLFTALGIWLGSREIAKRASHGRPKWASIAGHFRSQWPIVFSGVVTSGYTGFSVAIVALASGSVTTVAAFASAFRLQSMAKVGTGAVSNAFQGWVGEVRHAQPARRMIAAFAVTTCTGIAGGLALWLLLPVGVDVIFGAGVTISPTVAALSGVGFFMYSMTLSLSLHVLAPTGKIRTISVATVSAAVVGVPAMFLLTPIFGVEGAIFGVTLAEAIVLAIELPIGARLVLRSIRLSQPSETLGVPNSNSWSKSTDWTSDSGHENLPGAGHEAAG